MKCWEKGCLKEETSSQIPYINIAEIEQSIMRSLEEGYSKLGKIMQPKKLIRLNQMVKMRTTELEKIPTLLNLKLRSQKKLRLY